jgi:hypothetical protein
LLARIELFQRDLVLADPFPFGDAPDCRERINRAAGMLEHLFGNFPGRAAFEFAGRQVNIIES